MDVVERLRRWVHDVHAVSASDLMDEAANEIERLRLQNAAIRSGDVATLNDAERECLEWAEEIAGNCEEFGRVEVLRGLLGRTSPTTT